MIVKTLLVGPFGTNCYVVSDEIAHDCVIIDPAAEHGVILRYLEENSLNCRAIFLTHTHMDHVMALSKVKNATGAPVYLCEKELEGGGGIGLRGFKMPSDALFYKDGDEFRFSALRFRIMETPGHTPGSVTILCGKAMFSGDTLFEGSCGRTDLPGGNLAHEFASLRKLAQLPGDYDVYPGHMDRTTLAYERQNNPYMQRAVQLD